MTDDLNRNIINKLKKQSSLCDKNIVLQEELIKAKSDLIEGMKAHKKACYFIEYITNDGKLHNLLSEFKNSKPELREENVFGCIMQLVPYHMQNTNCNIMKFKKYLDNILSEIINDLRASLN